VDAGDDGALDERSRTFAFENRNNLTANDVAVESNDNPSDSEFGANSGTSNRKSPYPYVK